MGNVHFLLASPTTYIWETRERSSRGTVSSGVTHSETCLRLTAEQCDLEKGFAISEPISLETKHVGQVFF